MILDALQNTLSDLATAIGWIGLGVIAYLLLAAVLVLAWDRWISHYRDRQAESKQRVADLRAELLAREEHRQEIKVMGGHRVGPTIEAHHGKNRVGL